jgi:hypothetical protein
MSHDHLVECYECGMPIKDIRDCTCPGPAHETRLCGHCNEQKEYERQEARRNA